MTAPPAAAERSAHSSHKNGRQQHNSRPSRWQAAEEECSQARLQQGHGEGVSALDACRSQMQERRPAGASAHASCCCGACSSSGSEQASSRRLPLLPCGVAYRLSRLGECDSGRLCATVCCETLLPLAPAAASRRRSRQPRRAARPGAAAAGSLLGPSGHGGSRLPAADDLGASPAGAAAGCSSCCSSPSAAAARGVAPDPAAAGSSSQTASARALGVRPLARLPAALGDVPLARWLLPAPLMPAWLPAALQAEACVRARGVPPSGVSAKSARPAISSSEATSAWRGGEVARRLGGGAQVGCSRIQNTKTSPLPPTLLFGCLQTPGLGTTSGRSHSCGASTSGRWVSVSSCCSAAAGVLGCCSAYAAVSALPGGCDSGLGRRPAGQLPPPPGSPLPALPSPCMPCSRRPAAVIAALLGGGGSWNDTRLGVLPALERRFGLAVPAAAAAPAPSWSPPPSPVLALGGEQGALLSAEAGEAAMLGPATVWGERGEAAAARWRPRWASTPLKSWDCGV